MKDTAMTQTFKPMRSVAPDYEKFPITFPKLASPKLDGIRLCKWQGKVVTKSGKQIPNKFVRQWCQDHLPEGFDGELIVGPPNLETTYNTTFRGVMSIEGEPDFRFYVFDVVTDGAATAITRLEGVYQTMYYASEETKKRCVPVEHTLVRNQVELEELYQSFLVAGYEGCILKNPEGLYKFGRSTPKCQTQLKLKPEDDFDAQVVRFEEAMHNGNDAFINEVGETDRSTHQENLTGLGMVGGIWVRDSTGEFKISPGKMKHVERVEVWLNRGLYYGKWLKYRSMTYGVKDVPRHGRFLCWRDESDV